MHTAELIELSRDVDASIVPSGDKVTLQQGEQAQITQTLGGTYTVIINGNMFRIEGSDADALGLEPLKTPAEESNRKKACVAHCFLVSNAFLMLRYHRST